MISPIEAKILLNLLCAPDNRCTWSKIQVPKSVKESQKLESIRNLSHKQFLEIREETTLIKTSELGKPLINLENIPLGAEEKKILSTAATKAIKPSEVKGKSAKKRDEAIKELIAKGYLEEVEKKITHVTLTQAGKDYLATEYQPTGSGNITITPKALAAYINFLRSYFAGGVKAAPVIEKASDSVKPSDEEVLQLIKDLDRELGTDNYLPIFHLRNKLQPPFSRDELDQAIYRLQKQDKLELSSLVEEIYYTQEQLEAGIIQNIGCRLFFLIVT